MAHLFIITTFLILHTRWMRNFNIIAHWRLSRLNSRPYYCSLRYSFASSTIMAIAKAPCFQLDGFLSRIISYDYDLFRFLPWFSVSTFIFFFCTRPCLIIIIEIWWSLPYWLRPRGLYKMIFPLASDFLNASQSRFASERHSIHILLIVVEQDASCFAGFFLIIYVERFIHHLASFRFIIQPDWALSYYGSLDLFISAWPHETFIRPRLQNLMIIHYRCEPTWIIFAAISMRHKYCYFQPLLC